MRLVKATGRVSRRHLAVLAVVVASSACDLPDREGDEPGGGPAVGTLDACWQANVIPLRPRLVLMPLRGQPRPWAGGVCAACFAGTEGGWVAGDRDVIEVHVGQDWLEIDNDPRSPLRASHALKGVAIGDAVLLDRGDVWVLWGDGLPQRELTPLPLAPDQTVWNVRRGGDAITVELSSTRTPRPVRLPLVALGAPLPGVDLIPIDTAGYTSAGWIERGERGAALVGPVPGAERRLELGDTSYVHRAVLAADTVVAWTHRGAIVARPDGAVDQVAAPDLVLASGHFVLWIEAGRRRVRGIVDGQWSTVWEASAGKDFGGGTLAPGTVSRRLQAALSVDHLALVERLQDRSCDVADQLYVMDLNSGAVRATPRGPRLLLHIAPAGDGFGWIEAEVGHIGP